MIISRRSRRRCSGYGDLPAGRQTQRIQLILHIFSVIVHLMPPGIADMNVILHQLRVKIHVIVSTEQLRRIGVVLLYFGTVFAYALVLSRLLEIVVVLLAVVSPLGRLGLPGLGLLLVVGRRGRRNPRSLVTQCTGGDRKTPESITSRARPKPLSAKL